MLLLIVKGSRKVAEAAARAHSISFGTAAEADFIKETYLYVPDDLSSKVYDWFGEPIEAVPGSGYPDGTLLLVTKRNDR